MTGWVKWLLGAALLAGLVYLYYTEVQARGDFRASAGICACNPVSEDSGRTDQPEGRVLRTVPREIYDEWKTSIHAHAYESPFSRHTGRKINTFGSA